MEAMRFDSASASNRLFVAVGLSLALHAALMLQVRAPVEKAGARTSLIARILPVSAREPVSAVAPSASITDPELPVTRNRVRTEEAPQPEPAAASTAGAATSREPVASLMPDLPRYYTAKEVDVRAMPMDIANPALTEKGMILGRVVRVKLRIFISEAGRVDRFDVLETDGPAFSLDDVPEIRFHPAQREGRPVKSQKVIELSFVP
jgi:hypothetical protein